MKLHIHVWEEGQDDPIEEADFEHADTYISGDETDHIQFSGKLMGKHIEVRFFIKDIPELLEEVQTRDPSIAPEQHQGGFAAGKAQRDHDIQRAIDDWRSSEGGNAEQFIKLLKKYTEA